MEPTASDAVSMLQELRGVDDHTIINQYFDAIDKLVALVMEGHGAQAKDEGLCDTVLHLQDVSCAGCGQQGCSIALQSLDSLIVLVSQHPAAICSSGK
jgi:hypothetical protein